MYTMEEMQAFHILKRFKCWACDVDEEKAKEAGDYIIALARKIKKSRTIGPFITDVRPTASKT